MHLIQARKAPKKQDKKGIAFQNKRGTSRNRKFTDEVVEKVKQHVKSFPIMEADYAMERCKINYFSSNVSVAKFYDLYRVIKLKVKVRGTKIPQYI